MSKGYSRVVYVDSWHSVGHKDAAPLEGNNLSVQEQAACVGYACCIMINTYSSHATNINKTWSHDIRSLTGPSPIGLGKFIYNSACFSRFASARLNVPFIWSMKTGIGWGWQCTICLKPHQFQAPRARSSSSGSNYFRHISDIVRTRSVEWGLSLPFKTNGVHPTPHWELSNGAKTTCFNYNCAFCLDSSAHNSLNDSNIASQLQRYPPQMIRGFKERRRFTRHGGFR